MRELRMLVVAVALMLALPAAAQATTFAVDRLDDAHDADTSNDVCDAVGDGCTLRAAVEQAEATAGADQINLPGGRIVLTIGQLDVTESLTVVGAGIDASTIDGTELDNATFLAADGTGSLVLQDLGITGEASDVGDAVVDSWALNTTLRRAAIFDSGGSTILGAWPEADGTLTLDGARLYGNQARHEIVDAGPDGDGTVTITDTVINGNQVSSSSGSPGIVVVDPAGDSDVAITRSTFSENSITGNGGSEGVVDIRPNFSEDVMTTLRISDSSFLANLLGNGGSGALRISPSSRGGIAPVDAAIVRTRFEDNVAGTNGSGTGGAIDFRPSTESSTTRSLAITDSSFLRNVAGARGSGQGGAINWAPDSSGGSELTIDGSTFAGNRAGEADDSETFSHGGAIDFARGTLTVRNSTFSANRAEYGSPFRSGGAISFGGGTTAAQLTHVTMVGNSVGHGLGGGISVQGPISSTGTTRTAAVADEAVTVTNSIVAGNTTDDTQQQSPAGAVRAQAVPVPADCSSPVTSGGGNIEGDTTCGFTGTGDHQKTDPKAAPLADNGGPTWTHAIGKDSPAFDAALGSACLPKDQRGVTRPQFAGCDTGAFELGAPPPAVVPIATGGVQGQTQRKCVSRRAFRIRIRVPKGAKVVRATVLVNGKPVAVRRGSRLTAPVRLRGLPKGRFRVKIVLYLMDGRKVSGTRRYHTCHEAIPPKRVPKV
jgi:hypothetical protein